MTCRLLAYHLPTELSVGLSRSWTGKYGELYGTVPPKTAPAAVPYVVPPNTLVYGDRYGVGTKSESLTKGVSRIVHWGKTEGTDNGSGVLRKGASTPLPMGVWGALQRAEPRRPKRFPLFSELGMASTDTIILLIVDYQATIGGAKTLETHFLRMPLRLTSHPTRPKSPTSDPVTRPQLFQPVA